MRVGSIAVAVLLIACASARAQTAVKFTLDRGLDGTVAPYLLALDQGYYKAEGLAVEIDGGSGATESIARVASGGYAFGLTDLDALARFRDRAGNAKLTGVLMTANVQAFAIVSLKKNRIATPKDLEGRVLGAPADDEAYAHWQALAQANGMDAGKVRIEKVAAAEREALLVQGKVDAITGSSFSSVPALKAAGVAESEIVVLRMRDHGLLLYGGAVVVHPDFAKAHPNLVRGFVRATIKGFQDAVKDPDAAIQSLLKRDAAASEALERERLQLVLRGSVITPEVEKNGFGGVDYARLARAIDQIAISFKFTNRPRPTEIFTDEYLPPRAVRNLR